MRTLPNDAHFRAGMATGCNAHVLNLQSAERVRLLACGGIQ